MICGFSINCLYAESLPISRFHTALKLETLQELENQHCLFTPRKYIEGKERMLASTQRDTGTLSNAAESVGTNTHQNDIGQFGLHNLFRTMQGATAGAVYGEVTFRSRIPESVRREVRKCRNEPNFFDSRLLSDNFKTVSLLLVGFRGNPSFG